MTSTPVMSAPQEVTAKSLRQRVRVHGGEREGSESTWGGRGDGRGSCSGKMTSKPVMSSSSLCPTVTRQRRGQR